MSNKIELIKAAIANANEEKSKLTTECFEVGGFTSPRIRHLLNNLGTISTEFLEIGSHLGATFVATVVFNNLIRADAVDNFSETFNSNVDIRSELIKNMAKFTPAMTATRLTEKDCFDIPSIHYKHIDLYLYDGNHADWAQKKALTHFIDSMANEFIFVVDDFCEWEHVERGTREGIAETGVKIMFEQILCGTEWHQGIGLFLLRKTK